MPHICVSESGEHLFQQRLVAYSAPSHYLIKCLVVHDDIIKWKHFPRYWPFVRVIHWSPVNSPHKGQWRAWIHAWVNNREAGDLRRYRTHYDVTVMCQLDPQEQTSVKFYSKYKFFHSRKCIWKYRRRNGGHFVLGRWVNRTNDDDIPYDVTIGRWTKLLVFCFKS